MWGTHAEISAIEKPIIMQSDTFDDTLEVVASLKW